MAIWIDWPSGVINVPKADLTLIQSIPMEIWEMDLNWFRLQLKDLEDNNYGIVYQKTHDHNTEVTLGGVIYARIIEILDPYSVTFEDGQYAVNLVGANSNVGDKVNVNQVSVRSYNSAGLIAQPDPLTLTDITDSIWNAILSGYTIDGSAGRILFNTTTGGVDYHLLAQAVWEYIIATAPPGVEAGYILTEINTLVDELHKIQGLDPLNPMTVTRTDRSAGTIDLDIGGDGETITTVTRQ